jgi:hypothetical protein
MGSAKRVVFLSLLAVAGFALRIREAIARRGRSGADRA